MSAAIQPVIAHEWNTAPAPGDDLPLQSPLPNIGPERQRALQRWAWNQPAVRPWLLRRQHDYWEETEYPKDLASTDRLHQLIDAVVALDLARWQTGIMDNRAAIEKWAALQAAVEEIQTAEERKETQNENTNRTAHRSNLPVR